MSVVRQILHMHDMIFEPVVDHSCHAAVSVAGVLAQCQTAASIHATASISDLLSSMLSEHLGCHSRRQQV